MPFRAFRRCSCVALIYSNRWDASALIESTGIKWSGTLVGLVKAASLGAQTSRGRGRLLEVSAESGDQERSENDLGTTAHKVVSVLTLSFSFVNDFKGRDLPEHGQRQPQKENKLEDKVEGEPVDNVEEALNDGEEGENNPVL